MKKKIVNILVRIMIFKLAVTTTGFAQTKKTRWSGIVNNIPQWFEDAKFGIYFHLGPYSVPALGTEWYSRNMYIPAQKSPYMQEAFHFLKIPPKTLRNLKSGLN